MSNFKCCHAIWRFGKDSTIQNSTMPNLIKFLEACIDKPYAEIFFYNYKMTWKPCTHASTTRRRGNDLAKAFCDQLNVFL